MSKSKNPAVRRENVHYFCGPERSPHANLKFLLEKFPEGTWSELPLRKQVCLEYCKWLGFPSPLKKEKGVMVVYTLMKKWRTTDFRIGTKRTLLERTFRMSVLPVVRKLRHSERNRKNAKISHYKGTGNLVKVNKEKAYLPNLKKGHEHYDVFGRISLEWILWSPEGEVYFIKNLRNFCRERKMDWSHLSKTSLYPDKFYRGWKAEKRNKTTEWWGRGGFD